MNTTIEGSEPFRARIWRALEAPEHGWGRTLAHALIFLIILNIAAVIVGSVGWIDQRYGLYLEIFEILSVMIFTAEYLTRLWASAEAGSRLRFACSPLALADLLAVLPFYLGALFGVDLRVLRMLRLLRLLKLSRYFAPFQILADVFRAEARSMAAAMVVMTGLMIIAASLIHYAERSVQPEAFGDIPKAMWWAAVTLTTVGYGDTSPVTFMGKIIAILVMILGVGMVALPAGMLASRFSEELKARRLQFARTARHGGLDAQALQDLRYRLCISEDDWDRLTRATHSDTECPLCGTIRPGAKGG